MTARAARVFMAGVWVALFHLAACGGGGGGAPSSAPGPGPTTTFIGTVDQRALARIAAGPAVQGASLGRLRPEVDDFGCLSLAAISLVQGPATKANYTFGGRRATTTAPPSASRTSNAMSPPASVAPTTSRSSNRSTLRPIARRRSRDLPYCGRPTMPWCRSPSTAWSTQTAIAC